MAGNQTGVFVRWDDKADVIQLDNHSPLISHLRDAFKAKHLAASTVSTADIQVFEKKDGPRVELDAFDELGDLGKSRESAVFISLRVDVAVAVPPVPVTVAPSTPRSRDISNQVAAVFEGEGNMYLDNNFQSVLPQCEFSKFKVREIDDGNFALEMDSFSYMTKDTLQKPEETHGLGIYVVRPKGISKKKPIAAPKKKLGSSPGATAFSLVKSAEKYVIGESYCGQRKERMEEKVEQLENKLEKMRDRHAYQSGGTVTDVTSLFGAAILSFTCHSSPRSKQSKKCMTTVLGKLSSEVTPILWRLAQAERFFVAVLSTNDAANTCALREIASGMQNIELSVENIELSQLSVASGMQNVEAGLTTIMERLDKLQGKSGNDSAVEGLHKYD